MKELKLALVVLAIACLVSALASPASAVIIGDDMYVSGNPGCWWPDVAYGSTNNMFLVVWCDYNYSPTRIFGRFVSNSGTLVGNQFAISDGTVYGLYPAVAYNATNNEFLVVWDDGRGETTGGQRVRASDGVLLGGNFVIGSRPGQIRPQVAWSSVSNCYFIVTFELPAAQIYGQRFSNTGVRLGETNCSYDANWSGYPSVGYALSGNQFLATWDSGNGSIRGQRVDATNGARLGGQILVASTGCDCRSQVTYDSTNARWMVMLQDLCSGGVDQYGQLVNANGTLSGGRLGIATTSAFEGETNLGCDIAYASGVGRFFASFQLNDSMGVQELYSGGSQLGGQVMVGVGTGGPMSNASSSNRCLTVWRASEGSGYIRARLYEAMAGAPPGAVNNFVATPQVGQVYLSWTNPSETSFTGTKILFKTTGFPTGPTDGTLVVDKAGTPGSAANHTHTGLSNGVTYYYAAYAHDVTPAYSVGKTAYATPSVAPGMTIIPKPQEWTWKTGTGFLINSSTQIMANSNPDAKEQNAANQLRRKVWDMTGCLPNIVYGGSTTSNVIAIGDPARCPAVNSIIATFPEASGKASKSEGYMIGVKDTAIVIRGYDNAGTFYGCQTLIQIMEYYGPNRIAPLFSYDYPDLAMRGGMWKFIDSHDWEFTKELISEMMARYKINHLFVRVDNGMAWDSHPELPLNNPSNPVTKAEYIDIFNFGDLHYMVKMPSSAGSYHNTNEWITYGTLHSDLREDTSEPETDLSESLCPLHTGAQALVYDLWNEVNAATNTPYFGAGHSEYHSLRWAGCPRCTAYPTNAALYNQIIWNDYYWCSARGKEQIIWGDMLREDGIWPGSPTKWNTHSAVATIPDATIIADWEYGSPGNVATDYPTLDRWISNGLFCIGTPYGFGSYAPYNQYYGDKENIYYWATALNNRKASGKVRGLLAFNKYTTKDRQIVVTNPFEQQLLGCFPYYATWSWNAGDPYWNPYPYGNGWTMVEREISPDRVSGFTAAVAGANVNLNWTNPPETKFQATYIVYRTDRYPTSPIDGTYLADVAGSPSSAGSYTHVGAPVNGAFYAAFAHDNVRHFSPDATARVGAAGYCFQDSFGYANGALNGNGGWSGTATSAEIAIDSGFVRIWGGTTNKDAIKTVSCGDPGTGYINVTVKINGEVGTSTIWNLWVDDSSARNLARWYGSGTTARGRIGSTANVTATQTLTGGWDTLRLKIYPAANTTEFFFNGVSLGTLSHASESAGDAIGRLRFERIGATGTTGHNLYFDDLFIGEAAADTTPPDPVTSFVATPGAGQIGLSWMNPGGDFTGTKILFKTTGYPTSPTDGTAIYDAAGTSTTHTGLSDGVTYYYSAFAHDAVPNYASAANASGTPQAGFCFQDEFNYTPGALNGNGGWTGSAGASQIEASGSFIRIYGGAGSYDAVRTMGCDDQGRGYIMVRALIYKGLGDATSWSMWIDDSSSRNLARWYGSGTTARGRIGGTANVTPTQTLSTGVWDSLVVKIIPSTNMSEFYFNGGLIGSLSHASEGAGDAVGRIRFERIDNSGASGQFIYFDNIRVGGA